MKIEDIATGRNLNQLILFEGDYVCLHHNFYGDNTDWLKIKTIEPYDICVLSNGARVCASPEYISNVKSPIEYQEDNHVEVV